MKTATTSDAKNEPPHESLEPPHQAFAESLMFFWEAPGENQATISPAPVSRKKMKALSLDPALGLAAYNPVPNMGEKTLRFRRQYYPQVTDEQWNDWKWQLKHAITDFKQLSRLASLSPAESMCFQQAARKLPVSVTPYYMSLIDPNDPEQPLRRCVVPTSHEAVITPGEATDPLHEDEDSVAPGLVHRYPDRVLLLVTSSCSTYCRYCTRHRVVSSHREDCGFNKKRLEKAFSYIRKNEQVRDVLISGGDPLLLSDEQLEWVIQQLRQIEHVEMVRIGTKVPAVLPQRITENLVHMLKRYHPLFMSLHFTHPDELTPETKLACERLADAGIPLGSQTVLLAGVNDQVDILKPLFQGLLKFRVRPYYLYQCDPIPGSAHFRTPVTKGLEMIDGLRGHTTGYAVPTYVIDAPGGGGKIALYPESVVGRQGNDLILRNYEGQTFSYPDSGAHNPVVLSQSGRGQRRRLPMLVGLTYDLRQDYQNLGLSEEELAEFDSPRTVEGIETALQDLGYQTERIGHVRSLVTRLNSGDSWDLVFNICEGLGGYGREAQVPALLEAYGIPYVFSDPLVMTLTLHKGMTKHVIRDLGLPTPDFMVVQDKSDLDRIDLPYPLFAKPVAEGTGKGITAASKIRDREQLNRVCTQLLARYGQPVLVETYLPGREYTVGILGTGPEARVIAVMEVVLLANAEAEVYSYTNKEYCDDRVVYRLAEGPEGEQAGQVALDCWRGLGCRDGGRVDIRVDAKGAPNFMEVNPLAGLHPEHSDLPILCTLAGMNFTQLIDGIMQSALTRIPDRERPASTVRAAGL